MQNYSAVMSLRCLNLRRFGIGSPKAMRSSVLRGHEIRRRRCICRDIWWPTLSLHCMSSGVHKGALARSVKILQTTLAPSIRSVAVGRWFPPGTPVSSTRKLISSSSFHRLDMTLAVGEALNPNKPINRRCYL